MPITGCRQSGAISASGTSTKARSCSRGCGRISRSGASTRCARAAGSRQCLRRAIRQNRAAPGEQVEVERPRRPSARAGRDRTPPRPVQHREQLGRLAPRSEAGRRVHVIGTGTRRTGRRPVTAADTSVGASPYCGSFSRAACAMLVGSKLLVDEFDPTATRTCSPLSTLFQLHEAKVSIVWPTSVRAAHSLTEQVADILKG